MRQAVPGDETGADAAPDVVRLFKMLQTVSAALTAEGEGAIGTLGLDAFEDFSDNLLIVRPHANLGRFRFEFLGSHIAEGSRVGDVTGVSFGDIMTSADMRAILDPYRQVGLSKSIRVTWNHTYSDGQASRFTRMLVPLFAGRHLAMILGVVVYHDVFLDPVSVLPGRRSPR